MELTINLNSNDIEKALIAYKNNHAANPRDINIAVIEYVEIMLKSKLKLKKENISFDTSTSTITINV